MDDRYINLKELLPLYLQQYKELAEIMDTETPEFRLLESRHNQLVRNRYIFTCNEDGIARFEKILGITLKSDDTLEDRIFRCLTKWNISLPYNYAFLEMKLKELCGDEYSIMLDFENQTLVVIVGLSRKNQYNAVADMLNEIIPCNILIKVYLMYNTYGILANHTYGKLSNYTHNQLRNEVVLNE